MNASVGPRSFLDSLAMTLCAQGLQVVHDLRDHASSELHISSDMDAPHLHQEPMHRSRARRKKMPYIDNVNEIFVLDFRVTDHALSMKWSATQSNKASIDQCRRKQALTTCLVVTEM